MALDITSIALSKKIAQDVVETAATDPNGAIYQQITSTVDNAIKEFSETVTDDGLVNTYREIVEFIDVYKPQLDQAIEITSQHTADLEKEAAAREAADEALDQRVSTEETDRKAADATLTQLIANETAAREQSITELTTNFTARVTTEASDRRAADAALQTALDAEVNRAQAAERNLEINLSARIDSLSTAQETLSANLTAESDRATGAETQLQAKIDEAINAANSADAELRASIAELADTDAETLAQIQQAISDFNEYIAADGSVADGFRSDIDKNKQDIAKNSAAISANEAAISNNTGEILNTKTSLAAEETRAVNAENTLDSKITAILDPSTGILAAAAVYTDNKVSELATELDTHISDAEADSIVIWESIDGVQEELTNYKSSNDSAVAANKADIAANTDQIAVVASQLTTESTRAQAAEKALEDEIAEINAPTTGILDLAKAYTDTEVHELSIDITNQLRATNAEVLENETNIAKNAADLQELSSAVDAHIATAASEISATKTQLNNVQQELTAHKNATESAVAANTAAIAVLNSNNTVDGSVDFKIDAAINEFASEISADGTINTFKELVDYVADHGPEFSELVGVVDANTGKIAINTDDITALRSQLLQLDTLCKTLQAELSELQDIAISVTCNDTEILFAPGELTRYFAYGDSAIFTAKAADSVTDKVFAHLNATYTTGPNADKTVALVNIGENTSFGGTQYEFSNITGKATLNGVWADPQWAPTWASNGGTLQSGITDIRVIYGTGISEKDMPYAIGTGTELGTDTVKKFNGWTVSGQEVSSTGVVSYSGRSYISPTALNATATAAYTTVSNVRNKASKLGETYTISTSNSNSAVQSRICPIGALASDSYVVGGVQSVNGRTGFGFTKAGKPISEQYVWNGWMVPVVFDGEIAAGLKSGKFKASDLLIEVTATIHVGAGVGDDSDGRSSAWFDVQPSFSNLGSAFTWEQSNAKNGNITTNFTPFSGASVTAVTSAIGTTTGPVSVYSNGNTSYATTDSTQTRSVTGSDTNGFKIGFCCATYTANLPGTITGRNRHCNTYALWENIKYTVRLK